MNTNANVCCCIVTYNRIDYLKKLINALLNQTYSISAIYVFDNNSSDGTTDTLLDLGYIDENKSNSLHKKKIRGITFCYYKSDFNYGGSGGFNRVVKLAAEESHDYLWIMDDDVLPESNCLEELLKSFDSTHQACVPCRTDALFTDAVVVKYNLWFPFMFTYKQRTKNVKSTELTSNLTEIEAMVFEGPIVSRKIVKEIGYPDDSYFIFYDDSDYARRILEKTKIYYVKSAILHKQIIPQPRNDFSWREYYAIRNRYVFDGKYGKNIFVRKLRPFLMFLFYYCYYVLKSEKLKAKTVRAAYSDAIHSRLGKTVEPNQLDEYLNQR